MSIGLKSFVIISATLFLALQYKLWFAPNGFWRAQQLKQQITAQKKENRQLIRRNENLAEEVKDFKMGLEALEAHARNDLNMIKPNELFYLIVDKDKKI
jgi:cell division protein FtsB